MLELERPDSLVQRVVGALRAEIDAGHFPAESRLPTEQQLSERLNVSRSVVREAIAQLKSDGVLVARRGAGSFISQTPYTRFGYAPYLMPQPPISAGSRCFIVQR